MCWYKDKCDYRNCRFIHPRDIRKEWKERKKQYKGRQKDGREKTNERKKGRKKEKRGKI